MLPIKGIQKLSLIDYPGKICSIIFIGGCNFRCGFCQNPDLVKNPEKLPTILEKEIFEFLHSRKKWIDGICITGGEPCLYKELINFVGKVKDMELLVKLDTNGSRPEIINSLLEKGLIDYIAMDIKSDLKHYKDVANAKVDIKDIEKSVEIIKNSNIDYEFRTTVVPGLFNAEIARNIGQWLKGSKKYVLQQFRPNIVLDKTFEKIQPFSKKEIEEFAKIANNFFDAVEIRI